MMAIDGSSRHRLTDSPGEELFPAISADGKQLAFLWRNRQGLELVTKRIASEHEEVIRQVKCPFSRPDFSPDGKRIVYVWSKNSECSGFQRTTILTVGVNGSGSHAVASESACSYRNGQGSLELKLTTPFDERYWASRCRSTSCSPTPPAPPTGAEIVATHGFDAGRLSRRRPPRCPVARPIR
jgi:hypothetical protein